MNKPNLFSYATSELSQDAFICWLLSWASPKYKDTDAELYNCSRNLIELLFKEHGKNMPTDISDIEVRNQYKRIDALCIAHSKEAKYAIVIEDKTVTKNHSDQLIRYLELVKQEGFAEGNIIPIYYKTGDQSDYSDVIGKGYRPISRESVIAVLSEYKGENSILLDYRERLQSIEDEVNSFRTKNLSDWKYSKRAWEGFYRELKKKLGYGQWKDVSNRSGGFLGFLWCYKGNSECELYLQLEQDKFCFKLYVEDESRRKYLRSKCHDLVVGEAKNMDLKFKKPPRFGYGRYMTACIAEDEYRQLNADGFIDMDLTVEYFRKAEELLKSAREKLNESE